MVDVIIRKAEGLSGKVFAPPSKSYTQRMLIAALLSHGVSKISNPLISNDTEATLQAIKTFSAKVKLQEDFWAINGATPLRTPKKPINCGESGATLRFMVPVAALAPHDSVFVLGRSLKRRPIKPLLQSLKQLGVKSSLQSKEGSFVKVHGGGVRGGKTRIRGDVSSQFISGLMFACPMAREGTRIILATPLESKTYVQMTKEILNKHGIRVFISDNFEQLQIPSNQTYRQCNHEVPGDFSSAAFLLATAAITSSKVQIKNLDYRTNQGDKAIVNILAKMGLNVKLNDDTVEVEGEGKPFNAVDVDAKDMPDLVPVCAVLACYSKGTSRIHNAQRLKYKESDRLRALYVELRKMGADIAINEDVLIIKGPCAMHGNTINPHNDHRLVMACAVAALGASGETKIRNSECVKKSYPTFFNDLRLLGVDIIGGQFNG